MLCVFILLAVAVAPLPVPQDFLDREGELRVSRRGGRRQRAARETRQSAHVDDSRLHTFDSELCLNLLSDCFWGLISGPELNSRALQSWHDEQAHNLRFTASHNNVHVRSDQQIYRC